MVVDSFAGPRLSRHDSGMGPSVQTLVSAAALTKLLTDLSSFSHRLSGEARRSCPRHARYVCYNPKTLGNQRATREAERARVDALRRVPTSVQ